MATPLEGEEVANCHGGSLLNDKGYLEPIIIASNLRPPNFSCMEINFFTNYLYR